MPTSTQNELELERHCEGKKLENFRGIFYLSHIIQRVGLSTSDHTQEKWEMVNLCRLQIIDQRNTERPLPFVFYRSIFRHPIWEKVLFFPRWF